MVLKIIDTQVLWNIILARKHKRSFSQDNFTKIPQKFFEMKLYCKEFYFLLFKCLG